MIHRVVLIGSLLAIGVMSTARADDTEALKAMTWVYRINEVDAEIRATQAVAAADREMNRLEAIAKKDKSSQNVERYNLAKDDYERAYTARLNSGAYAELVRQMGARDYATLLNAYLTMDKRATSFGYPSAQGLSLDQQLRSIQNLDLQLCNAKIDQSTGTGMSVHKDVEVLRKEGGSWIPMYDGRPLFSEDTLRTGRQARLRIELRDRVEDGNRGPTVVNMGSDSMMVMRNLDVQFATIPKRVGLMDLIRGSVRIFTRNWGERSVFSVRTGTSLCSIRESDVEIYYDEENRTAKYFLHHGDVFVTHNAGTTVLPPGHEIEVINGYAGQPRPFQPQ